VKRAYPQIEALLGADTELQEAIACREAAEQALAADAVSEQRARFAWDDIKCAVVEAGSKRAVSMRHLFR
jgi:hypothetical protein